MADRVRRLRKSHGWDQGVLADRVGVARLSVTKWETGGHTPSADNLFALAEALGVTPTYLMYGEGGAYREAVEEIAAIVGRVLNPPGLDPQESHADEDPEEEATGDAKTGTRS